MLNDILKSFARKVISPAAALIICAFLLQTQFQTQAAEKVKGKITPVKNAKSVEMLTIEDDGDGAGFDESEILSELPSKASKNSKPSKAFKDSSVLKQPRMNYPPAPPSYAGYDFDTLETNMGDLMERFKKLDQYYEPRYQRYQDDEKYKIQSVFRDKIRNLVNAKGTTKQDAEIEQLLNSNAMPKTEELNYRDLLEMGVERLLSGDFKRGANFFTKAIKLDPNQPEAYYNLALTYFYRSSLPIAIINFKRAIDLKPDFAEAYNNLGICYIKAKLLEKGMTQLRQANVYAPALKEPIDNLYQLKNKNLDYNYNDKLFKEKHSLDTSSGSRIFSLKLTLCPPLLYIENAVIDEKRISLTPDAAYNNLVDEYRNIMLDLYPEINIAIKESSDLINGYNKYWDALNLLKVADELYDKKIYRDAENYYTSVLNTVPNICAVYYKRGLARFALKNYRGAELDFAFTAKNSDDDDLIRNAIKQIEAVRLKTFSKF